VEKHVALEWPTYRPKIDWRASNTARNVRRTVELKEQISVCLKAYVINKPKNVFIFYMAAALDLSA
jgi:hypothetical protein